MKKVTELESAIVAPTHALQAEPCAERNFSLISLASIGLVVGNVWPALAGSLLTSIFNGGAPGVIYEFIAASLCYFAVALVIAELASALPSSAGVHLWASVVSGRRYGRLVGYFAGWWNSLAWVFAVTSVSNIAGNLCMQIHSYLHKDFEIERWHVFTCSLAINVLSCTIVCLGNSIIPHLNVVGMVLILGGAAITILVCAVMIKNGSGAASSATVWTEWTADIGFPDGFVFISGMLNGAFAMGTPDTATHLAEEIPTPEINVPKAIGAQYALGFCSAFAFLITLLYVITDYDALHASSLPIAEVYSQATQGSAAWTTFLLILLLLPTMLCTVGLYVTCGRTIWTLARVNATPFSTILGRIDSSQHMPLAATVATCVTSCVLGTIYLGSSTAFNAFVASFILHSSSSYIAAVAPYFFRRKNPGFERGPFCMPVVLGFAVHGLALVYMVVWFVVYCFPYFLPTDPESMNYTCLIWGGTTLFVGLWWILDAHKNCVSPMRMEES